MLKRRKRRNKFQFVKFCLRQTSILSLQWEGTGQGEVRARTEDKEGSGWGYDGEKEERRIE